MYGIVGPVVTSFAAERLGPFPSGLTTLAVVDVPVFSEKRKAFDTACPPRGIFGAIPIPVLPLPVSPVPTRPPSLSLSLRARGDWRTALAFSRLVRVSEREATPFFLSEGWTNAFSPSAVRRACGTDFPSLPLTSPSRFDSVIKYRSSHSSGQALPGSISDSRPADDTRFLEGRIGETAIEVPDVGVGLCRIPLSFHSELSEFSGHPLTVLLGDSWETVSGSPS